MRVMTQDQMLQHSTPRTITMIQKVTMTWTQMNRKLTVRCLTRKWMNLGIKVVNTLVSRMWVLDLHESDNGHTSMQSQGGKKTTSTKSKKKVAQSKPARKVPQDDDSESNQVAKRRKKQTQTEQPQSKCKRMVSCLQETATYF